MSYINEIDSKINNYEYLLNIYNKEIKEIVREIKMININIKRKRQYILEFHSNILENHKTNCILRDNIKKKIIKYKCLSIFIKYFKLPFEIKKQIVSYIKLPNNNYKSFSKINKKIKILRLNGIRNN